MFKNAASPSRNKEATSSTSSQSHHPTWMSHWMNRSSKPTSGISKSSLIVYDQGRVDPESCLMPLPSGLKLNDGSSKFGSGVMKDGEKTTTMSNENLTKKTANFFQGKVGPMSLALAVDKEVNLLSEGNSRSSKKSIAPQSNQEQRIAASGSYAYDKSGSNSCILPHQSNHIDASNRPIMVVEKQLSNDNFTCLAQGNCKYQKFSTFFFHEKKTNDDFAHELQPTSNGIINHNFLPFLLKKQSRDVLSQGKSHHRCQPLDRVPCSVHNVETMRICTMVDSVEDSPGGPPKISQRSHHFLFTKETRVNMAEENAFGDRSFGLSPDVKSSYRQGVVIQPLWNSTDSEEKENSGNPSTSEVGLRNDSSAEIDAMGMKAPKNQHIITGMASSPLNKDDTMNENIPPAALDSSSEKTSKRPFSDMNEELPGLRPEVSSTKGMEPGPTSRVHSLDAKHLFPCASRSNSSLENNNNNRWIKRLKLTPTNSEIEESSSHEKFNKFFNKVVKCNKSMRLDPSLTKLQCKEPMTFDQNTEFLRKGGLKKRNQSMMMPSCSWIQRWSQRCVGPPPTPRDSEPPVVICEPNSIKLGLDDELEKKQFPSIAAMALMAKTMNGLRPCEFEKRGPVVVWSSKEEF